MSIKLIPAILVSLVLGFGLGSIPGLNEHLHWNLWFIIPISGLLLGMLTGWAQFGACYFLDQKVNRSTLLVLSVAAMIGYALVDYGIYLSTTVHLKDVQGVPEGDYKLSDLVSFWDYMSWRLGSSTISSRYGTKLFQMGAAGTTLSYIVDLGGALAGALGVLFACTDRYPYCDRCLQFKRREKKYQVTFKYEENLAQEIFARIAELIQGKTYKDIVSYCRELSERHHEKKGNVQITVDQRFCRRCREASIIGKIHRLKGREWDEVSSLSFSFTSQPGEHSSLVG